jgi:2,3-bisphosphoglycerate-independent phosphoglycerate mutase
VRTVYVHGITDGRDARRMAPNTSAASGSMGAIGLGAWRPSAVATGRWIATNAGAREEACDPTRDGGAARERGDAIERSYASGVTDEFADRWRSCAGPKGQRPHARGPCSSSARTVHARSRAFMDEDFQGFERNPRPRCYTHVALRRTFTLRGSRPSREHILVDTAAAAGKKTLRIAETESTRVTYFLTVARSPFPGETRLLIPRRRWRRMTCSRR